MKKVIAKIEKRYERILSMPATLQEKWLVLLNITMHCMYYIESSSIALDFVADKIDNLQLATFKSLFSFGNFDLIHLVQLNCPVEDGGFDAFML